MRAKKINPDAVLLKDRRDVLQKVEQLNENTLGVIGLLNMCVYDEETILRLVSIRDGVRRLRPILRRLYRSKNPLIRRWVDVSLPVGIHGFLKEGQSIRCPLCRNTINQAPCPLCSIKSKSRTPIEKIEDSEPSLPFDRRRYREGYRPGSPSKIRKMRARFLRREPLFQKSDMRS